MGSHRLPDDDASYLKQGKFRSLFSNWIDYGGFEAKLGLATAIVIIGAGIGYGGYKTYKFVKNHNTQSGINTLYTIQEQEFEQFIVRPLRVDFQKNLEGKLLPGKRLPFETKPTIDEIATSLESTFIYSLKKPINKQRDINIKYEEKNKPVQELTQILIELEKRGYDLESTKEAGSWAEKYVKGTIIPTLAYLKKRSPEMYAQVPPDVQLVSQQIEKLTKSLQVENLGLYLMLNDRLKFTAQRKIALAKTEALIQQSNNPATRRLERELEYLRVKDTFKPQK